MMNLTKRDIRNSIVDELLPSYPSVSAEHVKDVEKWMAEGGYTQNSGSHPGVLPPHGMVGHFIHGTLLSVWKKFQDLPE